jgi:hypothetical protein
MVIASETTVLSARVRRMLRIGGPPSPRPRETCRGDATDRSGVNDAPSATIVGADGGDGEAATRTAPNQWIPQAHDGSASESASAGPDRNGHRS